MRNCPDLNPQKRGTQALKAFKLLKDYGWATNEEFRSILGIARGGTECVGRLRKSKIPIHTFINPHGEAIYYLHGDVNPLWEPYAILTDEGLQYRDEISTTDLEELGLVPKTETAQDSQKTA